MSKTDQAPAATFKALADIHADIARDVWPNGARLSCPRCPHDRHVTTEQCANYLATGWPKHCGIQMTIEKAKQ